MTTLWRNKVKRHSWSGNMEYGILARRTKNERRLVKLCKKEKLAENNHEKDRPIDNSKTITSYHQQNKRQ